MIRFRAILIRYFAASILVALAAVAFLSLPAFEGARASLTVPFNLNDNHLTGFIGAVLVLIYAGIYFRLSQIMVDPLETLVRQAETNRLKETYARESSIIEFVRLRFVLESQSQNIRDMESNLEDMEHKWEWAEDGLEKSKERHEAKDKEVAHLNLLLDDLRSALKKLEAKNAELADQLEEESKRSVEEEVDKRSEEIYDQMRKAVQDSAFKTLWLPRFIQELTAGAKGIQRIADQLKSTWTDASLSRMYEDITEISRQSAEQVALLKRYENGDQSEVKQLESGESMNEMLKRLSESVEGKFPALTFDADASESIPAIAHPERLEKLLEALIEKTALSLREGMVSVKATLSEGGDLSIRVSSKGILESDQKIDLQEAQNMAHSLNGAIYVATDAEGAESVVISYPIGDKPVDSAEQEEEKDFEELARQRLSSSPSEAEV